MKLPSSNPIGALLHQRTVQRAAMEQTQCKVVASILLNRVYAVGKPMRQVPQSRLGPTGTADCQPLLL
ncbi:hypothetical protein K503DRAFT_78085 [Rhizopogon vinicolor AM-OR11-026]|uniref:Uncharacterized protein n=1 Tax=Rhizopogon vinicolor AM-OR11-026 TaxID=1314800 RepID=A0A1B7MFZ2_9AGAM|nr:hypothetical protein K503DRAFT_78085 [Rhizopogon vinicolor AM-OR11-026]